MAHATRINKKRGRRLGDQYGHLKRGTSNPTEMFIIHLGCSRTIYSPLRLVPKLVRLPQRRTSVARKYISNMFSTRVGMTFLWSFYLDLRITFSFKQICKRSKRNFDPEKGLILRY